MREVVGDWKPRSAHTHAVPPSPTAHVAQHAQQLVAQLHVPPAHCFQLVAQHSLLAGGQLRRHLAQRFQTLAVLLDCCILGRLPAATATEARQKQEDGTCGHTTGSTAKCKAALKALPAGCHCLRPHAAATPLPLPLSACMPAPPTPILVPAQQVLEALCQHRPQVVRVVGAAGTLQRLPPLQLVDARCKRGGQEHGLPCAR